jgi:hypothetical protein
MDDRDNNPKPRETEGEIPHEQVRHPETMYDRSDLSANGILYFLITLAITVFVIHLITWGMLRYYSGNRLTPVPRNAAIAPPAWQISPKGDPALRFPAPQLQPDPVADMNKFRAANQERLNTAAAGHVSIEQAMDALVKNGLPVRPAPALPPSARFGSGDATPAGAAGGTEPKGNE